MILALALSSLLSSVPHSWILEAPRAARLAVPEQDVADAPVELLTLSQLYGEKHRLVEDFPGLAGPITLLSVGAVGICAFGGLTYFLAVAFSRTRSFDQFLLGLLSVLTGAITIVRSWERSSAPSCSSAPTIAATITPGAVTR